MQEPFKFSTKAKTLERLQGKLSKSSIPTFIHFTVGEWKQGKAETAEKIRRTLGTPVVVRSSALNEDAYESSMAGYFESILDVKPASDAELEKAVSAVIASYGKNQNHDDKNQVLVQTQVMDVQLSGVIFTQDLETGSPYYVINYDDFSGRTDILTSGSNQQQKIFTYCKLFDRTPSDPFMIQTIAAIRELEQVTGHDALDIEFVISNDTFYLLQVRPIATKKKERFSPAEFKETLENIKKFFVENNKPFPNLAGREVAYGIMPDWNPAEIIGVDPKPLAFSLYRFLITDTVWPLAREELGYKCVGYQPGIVSLAGKPYIDIRMSFNTFLAGTISPETSEKLVNFFIRKLRRFQDYHDKVEFKVVYTCYVLDFDSIADEMLQEGFSREEIAETKQSLFKLTDDILSERTTSIDAELHLSEVLAERRERIVRSKMSPLVKIAQLGYDCRNYGTLPFSKLARFAFISTINMRALVRKGAITQEDCDKFFNSIDTVATEFLHKLGELKAGKMTKNAFLREYGHLRPGTYDIMSPTYEEKFDEYIDLGNFVEPQPKPRFEFDAATKKKIDAELKAHGFSVSADWFLSFVRRSVMAREESKLEFTKNLSYMLRYMEEYLGNLGISREEVSFVTMDDILEFSHASLTHDALDHLREKIRRNKRKFSMMKLIRLPPLIFMEKNVEYFRATHETPNFVAQNTVRGEVVVLEPNGSQSIDIRNKIVLIQNADPGYDWIFSHGIAGLVTEFGGAASHMTVRAAEFNIPAAIGCGSTLFNQLKGCKRIELNCAAKYAKAIL